MAGNLVVLDSENDFIHFMLYPTGLFSYSPNDLKKIVKGDLNKPFYEGSYFTSGNISVDAYRSSNFDFSDKGSSLDYFVKFFFSAASKLKNRKPVSVFVASIYNSIPDSSKREEATARIIKNHANANRVKLTDFVYYEIIPTQSDLMAFADHLKRGN